MSVFSQLRHFPAPAEKPNAPCNARYCAICAIAMHLARDMHLFRQGSDIHNGGILP
jgi:hypothetical protein